MNTRTWTVEVLITEVDRRTTARAVLRTDAGTEVLANGSSSRNPHDVDVSEIGDEVATARALNALAHRLLNAASDDITAATAEPARLTL